MSESNPVVPRAKSSSSFVYLAGGLGLLAAVLLVVAAALETPGSSLASFLTWAFATNSVQTMWYITRAAGLVAYLVLWLSVAWGLAVSSKILDTVLHRSFTYDFHYFLSWLAIGFTILHIGVLMFDKYLPYSLLQILLPFISPYRPLWVGIGVLGLYLMVLVTVTFYLRGRIGMKAFRWIHTSSLVAYLGITVHSIFSGTDSSLTSVMLMYVSTFLITVFLLGYWVFTAVQRSRRKALAHRIA